MEYNIIIIQTLIRQLSNKIIFTMTKITKNDLKDITHF